MTAVPLALGRLSLSFKLPWRNNFLNSRFLLNPAYVPSRTFSDGDTPGKVAFRAVHYPDTHPDPSLFEDEDEEYASISLPLKSHHTASIPTGHPCDPLSRLVQVQNFREAENIRSELVSMGIPIVPRTRYFRAALHVLNDPNNPNRYASFLNWFSLVIPAKASRSPYLNTITRRLFFNSAIPLDVAVDFGLICASKGYAPLVGQTVVGHIARYAEFSVTRRFLHEFYDAFKGCEVETHPHSLRSRVEKRSRWWSYAIRTQCFARRPQQALELLREAYTLRIAINQHTVEYVVNSLAAEGETELLDQMEAIGYTFNNPSVPLTRALLTISKDRPVEDNIAIALRILSQKHMSVTSLIPFFEIYSPESDRRNPNILAAPEINMLRTKAYRFSLNALSWVIHAEMIYHHRRSEWKHVLHLYHKYFHHISVPEDIVQRLLYRRYHFSAKRQIQPRRNGALPMSVELATFNIPHKLWADGYITSLAWNAIVRLTRTEREVHMLFGRFTEVLEWHQPHYPNKLLESASLPDPAPLSLPPPPSPSSSLEPSSPSTSTVALATAATASPILPSQFRHHSIPPSPTPADHFDNGHFLPFLRTFCFYHNFSMSFRILDHMFEKGINPNVAALGTVAGKVALAGKAEKAMKLVVQMERLEAERLGLGEDFLVLAQDESGGIEGGSAIETGVKAGAGAGAKGPWSTPAGRRESKELVKAFTNVMSGFKAKGMTDNARVIRDRMRYPWGFPFPDDMSDTASPIDLTKPNPTQTAADDIGEVQALDVDGADVRPSSATATGASAAPKSERLGDLADRRQVELVRRISQELDQPERRKVYYQADWRVKQYSSEKTSGFGLKWGPSAVAATSVQGGEKQSGSADSSS
ncbi:uncharacterized protein STEHIDRAFT_154898 [Stereum hirsutum FP-91666 SS1]|uniref:uncharacterized protein n=1 Tax=Stereum hirsutum (strain FP-91666) TaxID=721885 RepID=UPI000440BA5F|nr:uncharacterized protein STEHIDRAFT_154898 [Stereum hirsutum FP-91666 SS1]EIM89220.1 hypothetical protein STEHIDRAFT_154898 [Stereum hirsutum FP-91666 SS1]